MTYLHRLENNSVLPIEYGRIEQFMDRAPIDDFVEYVEEGLAAANIDLSRCLVKWIGPRHMPIQPSPGVPPVTVSDAVTGHIYYNHYLIGDRTHRTDGPAITFDDGTHVWEQYWLEGARHREDGAQEIIRAKSDGFVFEETHRINDITHRLGKPAVRRFDLNTRELVYEAFYEEDKRVDLSTPAIEPPL